MFRNFISKLPGFTTLSELPVSTPCNARMFRTLSPVKAEHRRKNNKNESSRPYYKRSYSFPSTRPKSYQMIERSGNLSTIYQNTETQCKRSASRHSSNKRSKSKHTQCGSSQDNDNEKKDHVELGEKEYFDSYQSSEQYELEGSRPKQSQSQIGFNVFEYIENLEKEHDPVGYLQPSNLRPFGSMDNTYIPFGSRPSSDLLRKTEEIEAEMNKAVKKNTVDSSQKREYSTKSIRRTSSAGSLIEELPPFEFSIPKKRSSKISSNDVPITLAGELALKQLKKPQKHHQENSIDSKNQDTLEKYYPENNCSANRGITAPPKPAYSETLKISEQTLFNQMENQNGWHFPNETTTSDRDLYTQNFKKTSDKNMLLRNAVYPVQESSQKHVPLCPGPILLNKNNSFAKNVSAKKSLSSTALHQAGTNSSLNYSVKKYSKNVRPLEPESCEKGPASKKCFLPSKVRLKPALCTPKPPPCPKDDHCPPRADDGMDSPPKRLARLKANEDCPCISPNFPTDIPKLKRLKFDFSDPIKICPMEGPTCPPRADDENLEVKKSLPKYIPSDCPCVEPPPMIDVPLKRLQKVCIPPEVCKPIRVCPEPEPCERADDGLEEASKELPVLQPPHCPCIIAPPQQEIPKLKRLNLHVPELARSCPRSCVCDEDCPRADDTWKQLPKTLPKLVAKDCPCMDKPMDDVKPLRRLTCIDEPQECYETDPCIDIPRADMGCWEYWVPEEKVKKKKGSSHNSKRNYNTDARVKNTYESIYEKTIKESSEPTRLDHNQQEYSTDFSNERKPKLKLSKSVSNPTVDLLGNLSEIENASNQLIKSEGQHKLAKNSVQVHNVRNFSSNVKGSYDSSNREASKLKCNKKTENESCLKPPTKCHRVGDIGSTCPVFTSRQCGSIRDPCNKVCKHVRPPVVCNRKAPPYPAFSELLDHNIASFPNTTECTGNRREFDYHVEEKKVGPPKSKRNTSKCYSTLAPSKTSDIGEDGTEHIHRHHGEKNQSSEGQPECENLRAETADESSKATSYCTQPYQQKGGSGPPQKEKNILKTLISPSVQSYRLESGFINKKGVEAIKPNKKVAAKQPTKIVKNDNKASINKSCQNPLCPKLQLPTCPPKAKRLPSCRKIIPIVCQKQEAPFKAFSDCLEGDLAENLSECPLERDKTRLLQPDYVKSLDKSKLIQPIHPKVGKLDLTAEDDCVRRRLCMDKFGVTRSCCSFGESKKLMRAKDLPKIRESIQKGDDEKNLYHNQTARNCKRKFCTCSFNPISVQRRGICSSHFCGIRRAKSETNQRKNYHLLCKTQERHFEDELDERKKATTHSKDSKEVNKSKVGSVQWRIDNYQKWHRLNNQSVLIKRCYSCPGVSREIRRKYSSLVANTVSYHAMEDDMSYRNISTSIPGCVKSRKLDPRKIKLSKTFEKVHKPKCPSGESGFKSINIIPECDYKRENFKILQPNNTNLSERTSYEPYPKIGIIDYNLGREYMRHRYGIKNEGITQDCSTFGTTLRCEEVLLKSGANEKTDAPRENCTQAEEKQMKSEPTGSGFSVIEPGHSEECASNTVSSPTVEEICRKNINNTEYSLPNVIIPKKPVETCNDTNHRERLVYKECLSQQNHEMEKSKRIDDFPCEHLRELHRNHSEKLYGNSRHCTPKETTKQCSKYNNTMWQRIANYFKARPDCPSPDEWKKKALRAKAEKAAKAAGLVLCDPKDLEKLINSQDGELPKVITPHRSPLVHEDQDESCFPRNKALDNYQKRNFTTTTMSTHPMMSCDPLYIGQYLNKVIVTIPLDTSHVNLLGSCRFPKILGCICNFPLQKNNSEFLKHSATTIVNKRYYSKHEDRKQVKEIGKTEKETQELTNRKLQAFKDTTSVNSDEEQDIEENGNQHMSVRKFDIRKESDGMEHSESCPDYPNRYFSRRRNLSDIIFPEDLNENPEYQQAKSLAAFQELFNKFDAYSDINCEELENLKTQQVLRELDKLLTESTKAEDK